MHQNTEYAPRYLRRLSLPLTNRNKIRTNQREENYYCAFRANTTTT
jgi:hypothetical protein